MIEDVTLRDFFAATYPQDESTYPGTVRECAVLLGIDPKDYRADVHWLQVIAKRRYAYADAMLAARAPSSRQPSGECAAECHAVEHADPDHDHCSSRPQRPCPKCRPSGEDGR